MQEFKIQMAMDKLIILYIANNEETQKIELTIPLKYLGNFWRALNIPLISCEVSLELKWDKNCAITSLEQRDIGGGNRDNAPTGATLEIKNVSYTYQ